MRSSSGFICHCAPPVKLHQLGFFLEGNPSDFNKELNDPALMEAILKLVKDRLGDERKVSGGRNGKKQAE